jgi:uncharacterized protein YjgD (DUF1641 family)
MANPLQFRPPAVDPRTELNRRLDAAPTQHAEALLVAWDILQSAHDGGMLDAVHGLVSAKDAVAGKVAEYAMLPAGVDAIRNLIVMAKIVGSLDPETIDKLSKALITSTEEHACEKKTPSMWQLVRRATDEDSRRGLSFFTLLIQNIGKAVK